MCVTICRMSDNFTITIGILCCTSQFVAVDFPSQIEFWNYSIPCIWLIPSSSPEPEPGTKKRGFWERQVHVLKNRNISTTWRLLRVPAVTLSYIRSAPFTIKKKTTATVQPTTALSLALLVLLLHDVVQLYSGWHCSCAVHPTAIFGIAETYRHSSFFDKIRE